MRITITDSVTLLPEHRARLQRYGQLDMHENVPGDDELESLLHDTDIAITGWLRIDRKMLACAPKLKMISLWATGFDHVDLKATAERGITVCNVPGYAAESIAEYVIGSSIVLTRYMIGAHRNVAAGKYEWRPFRGSLLGGSTIGIVGLGSAGMATARKAAMLGLRVLVATRRPAAVRVSGLPLNCVSMDELLAQSDIVTLHSALNDDTRKMMGAAQFAKMKKGAVLINTARAEMVDTQALVDALSSGHLGGAALDVLEPAPLPQGHPLLTLPNVMFTPHCAFNTVEASTLKTDICVENVEAFIAGKPLHVVHG